jgi:nucleotidyltransferase/DNA polymerase involved in DNA repair
LLELSNVDWSELKRNSFFVKSVPWLQQLCAGVDDEPVKERDLVKSIAASKNFTGLRALSTVNDVHRKLKSLCDELAERYALDREEVGVFLKVFKKSLFFSLPRMIAPRTRLHAACARPTRKCTAHDKRPYHSTTMVKIFSNWRVLMWPHSIEQKLSMAWAHKNGWRFIFRVCFVENDQKLFGFRRS